MANFFDDIELDDSTPDIVKVAPKNNTVNELDKILSQKASEEESNEDNDFKSPEDDIVIENMSEQEQSVEEILQEESEPEPVPEPKPIKRQKPTETSKPTTTTTTPKPINSDATVINGNIIGSIEHIGEIIVKGIIEGDLKNHGKITIDKTGNVTKSISSDEEIVINGNVTGKVSGKNITINSAKMKGNINATGLVTIKENTVIVGNITCETAIIDGAIKGNLTVKGDLTLHKSAVVQGQVKTNTLKIESGVALDGSCTLTNSDVDFDKIFAED